MIWRLLPGTALLYVSQCQWLSVYVYYHRYWQQLRDLSASGRHANNSDTPSRHPNLARPYPKHSFVSHSQLGLTQKLASPGNLSQASPKTQLRLIILAIGFTQILATSHNLSQASLKLSFAFLARLHQKLSFASQSQLGFTQNLATRQNLSQASPSPKTWLRVKILARLHPKLCFVSQSLLASPKTQLRLTI